nr:hypothetical protein NIFDCIIE_00041 [Klebsiella quasipneumoniae subsp. similipneumoniae]
MEAQRAGDPAAKRGLKSVTALAVTIPLTARPSLIPSMNYTKSGDSRNAENVVYLRDMPETAKQYTREFNRLWAESERIDAKY